MPTSSLSRKETQLITRKRLRESALDAFANKGVHGAGIEHIARAAGYTRGAFYANYDSKLDILIDILNEKQLVEAQQWRDFISTATDPAKGLSHLTRQYDDRADNIKRARINVELQLEADRNPSFRAVFEGYLDNLYQAIYQFYIALLKRYGKAPPPHLHSLVVTTRLLGLGLGSTTALGHQLGQQLTPTQVMLDFIHTVIESAPPLKPNE